jgi:hypothetical protein
MQAFFIKGHNVVITVAKKAMVLGTSGRTDIQREIVLKDKREKDDNTGEKYFRGKERQEERKI